MKYFLKIKNLIIKLLTFWIFPKSLKKQVREFLFYFSIFDLIKFKRQNFHTISLGENCLPRMLLTAIKLKPRKFYGEKTMPFDLCIHKDINKITQAIENDFEDYFDGLIFENNGWINKKYDVIYMHDNSLNQEQFIKRYQKRIENFKNIFNSNKILYFIYSNYRKTPPLKSEIEKLYETISKKRNGKPFELIILVSKEVENLDNIKQIIGKIDFNDTKWGHYIMDKYHSYDNSYTQYRNYAEKKLKEIIKN